MQPSSALSFEKKRIFIGLLEEFWPNTSKAYLMAGISYQLYEVLLTDPDVITATERIKRHKLDRIEGFMGNMALTPKGFMDRIAILRAHRPERWDREKQIVIQHKREAEQIQAQHINLSRLLATDAEVIEATGGKIPVLPDPARAMTDSTPTESVTESEQDLIRDDTPTLEPEKPMGVTPDDKINNDLLLDASDGLTGLDMIAEDSYGFGVIDFDMPGARKHSAQKNQLATTVDQPLPPSPPSKKQKGKPK